MLYYLQFNKQMVLLDEIQIATIYFIKKLKKKRTLIFEYFYHFIFHQIFVTEENARCLIYD